MTQVSYRLHHIYMTIYQYISMFPGCKIICYHKNKKYGFKNLFVLTLIEITFYLLDLEINNMLVQTFQVTWLFGLVIVFRSFKTFSVCGHIIRSYLCVVCHHKG